MLRIRGKVLDEIRAHMEESYPNECCGLIVGRLDGADKKASKMRRCRNLNTERARDRYLMDPKDQLLAERELDGTALDIIGIYHSHPDHPSRPSQTDLDAAVPVYSYMIGSVEKGAVASLQSWELNESGARFDEEPVEVYEEES